MKQLLCIWLTNWPIQRLLSRPLAEQLLQPPDETNSVEKNAPESFFSAAFSDKQKSSPIILWQTDPRRGRLVAAACSRAAAIGVRPRMPIADNTSAAWAHAHFNRETDFVSTGDSKAELDSLNVAALRIEESTIETLGRLGVETIGSLLRLPRSGLTSRLGRPLVDRIASILGEIDQPLDVFHAEAQHICSHDLEYPTDDLEILLDRIERLIGEIVNSLSESGRGALRLSCRLDLSENSEIEFDIGLFAPTLDQKHLLCLFDACLQSRKLPAQVAKITLSVSLSGLMRTSQSSLFGNAGENPLADTPQGDQSLGRLIDALTGRLGRDAVIGVQTSNDPLPENAFELVSLTDHKRQKN